MRLYREMRTAQRARQAVATSYGFRFAGNPAFVQNDWETAERTVISEELKRADVFIDVGANQGIYSCIAAQAGVAVVAVEPEAGNLRFLLANLRQFDNVEIYPVAMAGKPGILDLYGDGDTASLISGWLGTPRSFRQSIAVNTMDHLFAHRWPSQRLLIKVDVEGAETNVLDGATQLIERGAVWLIESFVPKGLDRLKSAGYDCRLVSNGNYLCARR